VRLKGNGYPGTRRARERPRGEPPGAGPGGLPVREEGAGAFDGDRKADTGCSEAFPGTRR